MKNLKFWLFCVFVFIFWKLVFSTDIAKDMLKSLVSPSHRPEISSGVTAEEDANVQHFSQAQIKQIEDIAQNIAVQSNANNQAVLDEMTVSFNAIAIGRNVRFASVIRVKENLSPQEIKVWLDATRNEIVPKSCTHNLNNPAFDRGLSYTFAYSNTYGEKLGDVFVDKEICKELGL